MISRYRHIVDSKVYFDTKRIETKEGSFKECKFGAQEIDLRGMEPEKKRPGIAKLYSFKSEGAYILRPKGNTPILYYGKLEHGGISYDGI
ncbi:hypothetical protein ACJMK2_024079 [Sinanodonta woodiana]|uniref:Uncharacterized protein n=1 Tax=Sinanodonta woodiana TaxID=1069815 RepID=A0ABD3T725_SINWO